MGVDENAADEHIVPFFSSICYLCTKTRNFGLVPIQSIHRRLNKYNPKHGGESRDTTTTTMTDI